MKHMRQQMLEVLILRLLLKVWVHLQSVVLLDKFKEHASIARFNMDASNGLLINSCLLSLIQYYGGSNNLEKLRELSGTTKQGTTLLGLYQAANKLGFTVD